MFMDDWASRFVSDLIARLSGPMTFRLLLQPMMAALYAIRDGIEDAREDRPAYFWSILTNPDDRSRLLSEGWTSVLRIIILGVLMDAVYQLVVFRSIHPLELVVVVLILAFVPYLLLRGPVNRIAQHFIHTPRRPQPLVRR
jgi:hypothetical protein